MLIYCNQFFLHCYWSQNNEVLSINESWNIVNKIKICMGRYLIYWEHLIGFKILFTVFLYSAAKNKSSKPHFIYWTAQLHNTILLRKSAEIKKWFDPCSCWSKTSLHTKNQVPSSKKGNFGFLGLSKKVRNVCGKGQKSKNGLTHLHVG